jgi:LysM repeat protein
MNSLKIVNKGRFIRSTLLTIILVMVVITTLLSATGNLVSSAMTFEGFSEYQVRSGDTLWNIAKSIQQEGDDIRALIHLIETENNLSNAVIHPGQLLKIPGEEVLYVANTDY